jgi:hypothetical protein
MPQLPLLRRSSGTGLVSTHENIFVVAPGHKITRAAFSIALKERRCEKIGVFRQRSRSLKKSMKHRENR